jgi:predicted Fe-Mo cluster-binding NifX family protein
MGSRARAIFNENHIEVIIGVLNDDPEKAVTEYIKGELSTGDNICDH